MGFWCWRRWVRPAQVAPPAAGQTVSARCSSEPQARLGVLSMVARYWWASALLAAPLLLAANRLPMPLAVSVFACLAVHLAVARLLGARVGGASPLMGPAMALWALAATLGLYASPTPADTAVRVLQLAGCLAAFTVVAGFPATATRLTESITAYLMVGAAIALAAAMVMFPAQTKLPFVATAFASLPSPVPRTLHPNYVAGALVLFAPLALWRTVFADRSHGIRSAVLLCLIVAGLLLTQSRGALAAATVAIAATAAAQWRWARAVALAALLAAAAAALTGRAGFVLDPVGTDAINRTWDVRFELWQRAVFISQDFAFTGIGLATFGTVVDLLYPLFLMGPEAAVPHAHNLYLQVAASAGYPGYMALWLLLGAWGGLVWDLRRLTSSARPGARWRAEALGLAGGMIAFLAYSLTDAVELSEKGAMPFWVCLALTLNLWRTVTADGGGDSIPVEVPAYTLAVEPETGRAPGTA